MLGYRRHIYGVLLFIITALMGGPLYSQTAAPPFSLSLGLSLNNYSVKGVAGGSALLGEYRLVPSFALGAAGGAYLNTNDLSVEIAALGRWYPWGADAGGLSGFFADARIGAATIWHNDEKGKVKDMSMIMLSAGAGIKINLNSSWYIEPMLRAGDPFIFDIAIAAGRKFGGSTSTGTAEAPAARSPVASADVTAAAGSQAALSALPSASTAAAPPMDSRSAPPPSDDATAPQMGALSAAPPSSDDAAAPPMRARFIVPPEAESVVLEDGLQGYALQAIPFYLDSADLNDTALTLLAHQGTTLKQQYSDRSIIIQGHCAQTAEEEEWTVSQERAQNVADYLVREGYIRADQYEIQALGVTMPVAANDTWTGRQQNRRAIIIIVQN
ncbi:OmpA family protein [Breznakiellaceae bacterium SP9]